MVGFICTEAKDGHDARRWLENERPDLIVTDHQMPRVTGLELSKGLKSQKTQKRYQLFFYSVQLTADLKTHALLVGANAVLEKPIPLKDKEFLDLVVQVCEKTME